MLQRVISWALHNPLVVLLLASILAGFGIFSFVSVNVEAYPDPAPAIVEVIAQYTGASAEEVERQVTVPLEVTFAGMPHLTFCRTRSLFGLCHLRLQFEYGWTYEQARQEVINRISQISQPLPPGVGASISPASPTGEIYRYSLASPHDASGHPIYTLNDLKALQDWGLEREFRRVNRIVDVSSAGGTVKRFEIHPDPERLRRYGITLSQFQSTLANANINSGGDVLMQGGNALNVRNIGLYGGGFDPMQSKTVLAGGDPAAWLTILGGAAAQGIHTLKPTIAAAHLRREDERRLRQIRNTVVTSLNNMPIRVEDLVDSGPLRYPEEIGMKGVVVGNQTRLGRVSLSRPKRDANGRIMKDKDGNVLWNDEEEKVQCIVLLRKGEDSLPALKDVQKKVAELNDPASGIILPGVKIEPYYDRTDLIGLTTETVHENLILGMTLVAMILLMFLGNVRVALIVALNIPLALLFAFGVLYARGKSANLLSIGAVDFGIIIDSTVIMAESVYRKLTSGEHADWDIKQRILHASSEIQRALLFSTAIMVCAFIPLFAMTGAEGQLFGPMADTYAFALGGGLMLAVLLTPVLCRLILRNLPPTRDNYLVRVMKRRYLHNVERCLKYRWLFLAFMGCLVGTTLWVLPHLGREFMPELEEGNLWVRGMYPRNSTLDVVGDGSRAARAVMRQYSEVEAIANQMGRPDDGTDPEGFYKSEFFVPLRPRSEWPASKKFIVTDELLQAWKDSGVPQNVVEKLKDWKDREFVLEKLRSSSEKEFGSHRFEAELARTLTSEERNRWQNTMMNTAAKTRDKKQEGFWAFLSSDWRPRTKNELIAEMTAELRAVTPGVDWNFSQNIRDNVMEAISGVKGDNSIKIFGPDLEELQRAAKVVAERLQTIPGIKDVGVMDVMGQPNLDIPWDSDKCKQWGVTVADLQNVIQTAVGGQAFSTMIEGEKRFDISLRWPMPLRDNVRAIMDIPVDVINNQVASQYQPQLPSTRQTNQATGLTTNGSASPGFAISGSQTNATNNYLAGTPRRRLGDLVTPYDAEGMPNPEGSFIRPGASMIFREQGKRMIAVKFGVRGRDLAGAVAEAREAVEPLIPPSYRTVWSGEFEQMQDAEFRLMFIIPLALILIFILLYTAFNSLLDAVVVLSNVVALSIGGVWALYLTDTNFSTSAAVGFVSLFGVAIMDGLLLISYFNALRAQGMDLREAIMHGAEKRVRPVVMTALTAILGLLPAALAIRPAWDEAGSFRWIEPIGVQTQRPLAIVVVGGMITTLALTRYLMPVLYSFYG
ncbi:MAG TPA: efflux RND transporter permease subunit, partial [Gemmata sp.]|nr:efflux RND transporter permease subunit [Gemmata sp.]